MVAWSDFAPWPGMVMRVTAGEAGIRRVEARPLQQALGVEDARHSMVAETIRQLQEYFAGKRRAFTLPLDLQGTPFQRRVWHVLTTIPYGETRSYRWLAEVAGCPRGYQAAGQANGANPICIIVPCHRVIASGGGLGGYAYGLEMKRKLLAMEFAHAGPLFEAAAR
jgi:methylated-DNA-[protein]-cysteine S-methyltransferase